MIAAEDAFALGERRLDEKKVCIAYNGRVEFVDEPILIRNTPMANANLRSQLVDLLNETGPAHHRAYFAVNGADPDWPLWYAEYMQARLNALLGAALTRSELTYLLVLVEKERQAGAPGSVWMDYYADFFIERYGAMAGHMPEAPRM